MIIGEMTTAPATMVPVGAAILAVPHGVAANGDMLIGLQISPVPVTAIKSGKVFDLVDWPAHVLNALASLTLHVADVSGAGVLGAPLTFTGKATCDTKWTSRAAAAALKLWKANFSELQAQALVDALSEDMKGVSISANERRLAPFIDTELISRKLRENYIRRVVDELTPNGARQSTYKDLIDQLKYWAPPGTARDELGIMIERADLDQQQELWKAAASPRGYADFVTLSGRNNFSVAAARAEYRAAQLDGRADAAMARVVDQVARASINPFYDVLGELQLVRDMNYVAEQDLRAQSPKNIARRKLASILATPSIATFVGMNVEVRVARDDWRNAIGSLQSQHYGAIAVSFDSVPPPEQGWTAFVHGGASGDPDFFGPCDRAEALAHGASSDAEIVGGVLNLRRKTSDGKSQRYSLDILDVVASFARRQEYARRKLASLRRGETLMLTEPNLVGRGLTLVDSEAHEAEVARNDRARKLERSPNSSINYAADLLRGYSVMIGIPTAQMTGYKSAPARWRTVMARRLSFDSKHQIDRDFVARSVDAEREFGIVKVITAEQKATDQSGQYLQVILPRQEVFSWHGDSLTVATPSEKELTKASIDVCDDFAVSRTYHLPDAPRTGEYDYRPAPLRDGLPYLVALSASYVGGWGLSVQRAAAIHADDRYGHVLGGSEPGPFTFKRPDKIPAPIVLLPSNAWLVRASPNANLLGETITTLVVRSASGRIGTEKVQRFFFPHGVDPDRAEQQDQFRGVREPTPPGAFRSKVGILWAKGGGSFPLAVGGKIRTSAKAIKRESRGQVLHFRRDDDPLRQYYPDANSQHFRVQLATEIPANVTAPTMGRPVEFWSDGHAPRHAMPVLLELKALRRNDRKPRIKLESDKFEMVAGDDGLVKVRKVIISIQPATKIKVLAVAQPNAAAIVRRHLIGDALRSYIRDQETNGSELSANLLPDEIATQLLDQLLEKGIVRTLNGVAELTLVHAQQRPDPPRFILGESQLTPVVVTVEQDPPRTPGRSWPDLVMARRQLHQARYRDWESEEGGATCFFVGQVEVDAPATGVIRCEATWDEYGPEYLKRVKPAKGKSSERDQVSFKPGGGSAELFVVNDIDSSTTAITLDLLGAGAKPRSLAHSFPDGRARLLKTTLVATSRFVEHFEHHDDCVSKSATIGIWLPCTFLPSPPTVDRINPVFDYDYRSDGRGRYSFTRTSCLRLELGDDVFVTGEGECIGVLFRAKGTDPCDLFTPELEPYADGFTVQGRDALHQSPTKEHIGPERLRSGDTPRCGVLKAERVDSNAGSSSNQGVDVHIVPHALKLDTEAGYYCDINFDPRNANERAADLDGQAPYMPFVHLGLARYQEHAVNGLQLSHAVGRDVQLLPWRHGSVQFDGSRKFIIRIEGPMIDEDSSTAPRLEITVVRNNSLDHNKHWVPVAGRPGEVHCTDLLPQIQNGRAVWEWVGLLPHSRKTQHYGIRVNEKERQPITEDRRHRDREIVSMTIDLRLARTKKPVEMVKR